MNRFSHITGAALLGLAVCATARADLLGDSVTLRYDFAGFASTFDNFVVGAGPEITCTGSGTGNANVCGFLNLPGSTQTIDLGAMSIAYAYLGPSSGFSAVSPNSFNFLSLDAGGPIVGFSLATTIAGLDASRISFSADSVTMNMSGLPVSSGQGFVLTLNAVPEPATAALLALGGVAVLGLARRTSRARAAGQRQT